MKGIILHRYEEGRQPDTHYTQIKLLNKQLSGKEDFVVYNKYSPDELYKYLKSLELDIVIAYYDEYLENMDPLSDLGIPIIMSSEDTNKRFSSNFFKELVEKHKPDGVLVQNKCSIPAFEKYLGKSYNFLYFPWGVDTTLFKDYKEKKIYDITISGKFASYMFRKEFNYLLSKGDFVYKRIRNDNTKDHLVPYDTFVKELNRSKISLGGCLQKNPYYEGIFIGSHLRKNVEIPASRSCLINTTWGDKELMGFKDGVNFIEFHNRSSFLTKLTYYLDNEDELMKITDNGFKHTIENFNVELVVSNLFKDIYKSYG